MRVQVSSPSVLAWVVLSLVMLAAPGAHAQVRPYIGYVYPPGGQQGTTFQVKLGGQGLEDVDRLLITGDGFQARVLEYNRVLNPQEITLLNEQLRDLKRANLDKAGSQGSASATTTSAGAMMSESMMSDTMMSSSGSAQGESGSAKPAPEADLPRLIRRIERRVAECVNRPASVALANIVYAQITLSRDAAPGLRELRLATPRGISNPLVFHVGQVPEISRKPMITAPLQVLGKEELALRKRPPEEVEQTLTLPCTANGQVASGEINKYRFSARRGQRLAVTTQARELIPFVADAVPGWFQPVIAIDDADGKEVAYEDDFRFKPDPALIFQVKKDGDYFLKIYDALFRGREDFVYRLTIGEMPFVTSLQPFGRQTNASPAMKLKGCNLAGAVFQGPPVDSPPGIYRSYAVRDGLFSNPLLFAVDPYPEFADREPNNDPEYAVRIELPVTINGLMDAPRDCDVFRFTGKANETVVAEVFGRRLGSPLDSILKLTDSKGNLLAVNDDYEDFAAGVNTHDADSFLMTRLPADGDYFVHLSDTAQAGGEEFGYRLQVRGPQPDFELRVVPSSLSLRGKSSGTINVHLKRKEGFNGPIKLGLKEPSPGFSVSPAAFSGTQTVARLTIKTELASTPDPVNLRVIGSAKIGDREVIREAVPAEDRMQAFLWRHLVPAEEFKVLVYDNNAAPSSKRTPRPRPAPSVSTPETNSVVVANSSTNKPKFSRQQVSGRLRQLKLLYEEGLLTDDFYDAKVAECEAAL
jgi:hypothetical protein